MNNIIALILATIALLAAAIAAAVASIFVPPPGSITLLIAAAGFAFAATALMQAVLNAIRDYQRCRDASEGSSNCSLEPTFSIFTNVTSFIGGFSFLGAAAIEAIPFIGKILNMKPDSPRNVGIVSCGIAIALLLALIGQLLAYKSCRDKTVQQSPGTSVTGPTGPGTTPFG